ncbi:hypothetical protein HY250_02060 [Candidatus Azambacteria bacterium]|nr:hypothetical protein [Candidatus Azambacteria bacterium]MBI3685166.1 hypothetical protein [Candidatus Azambacteria bacterium]
MKKKRLGQIAQKILLLLEAGVILGLTSRPDHYFRVVKQARKAWRDIDEESVRRSIKRLYRSEFIGYKEHHDGAVALTLTDGGKQRVLHYHVEHMKIEKPARWDGRWRMVVFDIPERLKQGRMALSGKLKELGFYPFQKSVFIFPYPCKDEIDFIIELFNLRPYVRTLTVLEIDTDLDLRRRFHLPI